MICAVALFLYIFVLPGREVSSSPVIYGRVDPSTCGSSFVTDYIRKTCRGGTYKRNAKWEGDGLPSQALDWNSPDSDFDWILSELPDSWGDQLTIEERRKRSKSKYFKLIECCRSGTCNRTNNHGMCEV